MKNTLRSTILLALASVPFIFSSPAASASAQVDPELRQATGSVKVIVLFKNRVRPVRTAQASTSYLRFRRFLEENARVSQKAFITEAKRDRSVLGATSIRSLWLINAAIVELPANKIPALEGHPDVRAIHANRKLSIIRDYSEKPLRLARGMDAKYTYGLNLMSVPRLRSEDPKADGRGILVGIIDTGIDAKHPFLRDRVVGFRDFIEKKGSTDPYDNNGHGTHVAGTIAGFSADSSDQIGVAPGAKLLIGKVFTGAGSATLDAILAGMQWMSDPDGRPETGDEPSLISNSWGGGMSDATKNPADDILCQAVSAWVDLGIFPVFAAGNSGPRPGTVGLPGACPDAFAIGATDESDALAKFSSRGPAEWKTGRFIKPNVSAPGVAVVSAWPGGTLKSLSGTSMATPHVAGLLSLIYQANPTIEIGAAADLVGRTTKDLGKPGNDDEFGWGRVDAFEATRAAQAYRRR